MAYEAGTLASYVATAKADMRAALTYLPDGTLNPVPYLLMQLMVEGIGPVIGAGLWLLAKTDETTAAQAVPGTATGEGVDWHGQPVSRFRRAASPTRLVVRVFASGAATFTTAVVATRQDGVRFLPLSAHTFSVAGFYDIVFECQTPGSIGVTAANVPLSMSNAPTGIVPVALVRSVSIVGLDAETDEVYRPDVVAAYQGAGAQGGTAADWIAWCKEVDGVYGAVVTSPTPGQVTIKVQAPGPSTPDGTLLAAVVAHLTAEHDLADVLWTVEAWTA